jgi:hypothetical protein
VSGSGSQRPLQQSDRDLHAAPGPAQLPAARQAPTTQRTEQHSVATAQGAPFSWHARVSGNAQASLASSTEVASSSAASFAAPWVPSIFSQELASVAASGIDAS